MLVGAIKSNVTPGIASCTELVAEVMATPSTPANSMQELIALLKSKPESVTLGTYGAINMMAMVGQFTKSRMGATFYVVPYKSASQALNAAHIVFVSPRMALGTNSWRTPREMRAGNGCARQ